MKEEIPRNEIRHGTGTNSSTESSKLSSLSKNSVNGVKPRDGLRRSEAFNRVSKETRTKTKAISVEGNAKKGDQASVRVPSRNPIGSRTEAVKKSTGTPHMEIHQDTEFGNIKTSAARMNPKLRTIGGLNSLKQSQRSINLDSDCNHIKPVESCCPTHEIRQLRRMIKGLQETEETLQSELLHEQKDLFRALHKVTVLEKELGARCTEIEGLNMRIVSLSAESAENIKKNLETTTSLETQILQLQNMNAELENEVLQLHNMTAELVQEKRELADKLAKAQKAEYDALVQKKTHTTMDMEIQVVQLQNTNAELEAEVVRLQNMNAELVQQKREMANKLGKAESEILVFCHPTESKKLEQPNGMSVSLPGPSRTLASELAGKITESKDKHRTNFQNDHDKMKIDGKKLGEKEMDEQKEEEKKALTAKQILLTKSMGVEVAKRPSRIPKPPPKPSLVSSTASTSVRPKHPSSMPPPPPSPPSPPPKCPSNIPPPPPMPPQSLSPSEVLHSKTTVRKDAMQKAPEVVQFYRSLMKRDSKKDSSAIGNSENPDISVARSSMIGEIENRSAHLLAIKEDVETQGDFVRYLIQELRVVAYTNIEDVLAFVQWLDEELSFLVDERAVLKHFDWPEKKADTMREAAFTYRDMKKLKSEVLSYDDDLHQPSDVTLKRMTMLLEKLEQIVYKLLQTRERTMALYKEFQIPIDWMLDDGLVREIKLSSVKLAKRYMKRISIELESMGNSEKEPAQEFLLLQGVRFAFRAHQFAGGFDAETMCAFEELRHLVHIDDKESQDLNNSVLSA
ncbi:hypothetical protein SUGI_0093160 [Cryptomeria japonica]|uniref:protein CHUP1, chloroplastic n=1 Tax=Cryptomeria japonica TaxID=3369 RepID=UPI0024089DAD|nr:protein CHUP1, chloroplastic [Cryptomeria japonica]XP_057864649.2 protein CHUP1, chloroplastic [Cryptomeria japonica]XP_057864650.2 protein CHUP1, chloroplastic [Cryptomeria japonica]GLJ08660.1 hypothetical protein SUGI_0093160 [Cryptomeria japonica]